MPYTIDATKKNLDRLSEDKLKEIIQHVNDNIDESEKVLNPWKSDLVTFYDLYQLVQKKKNYDGLAEIFVPEILRSVETIVAKVYGMLFDQDNWFEFVSRDNQPQSDGPCLAMTDLMFYQCDENNFKTKVMDSLRQLVITGLTVRKIGWDYQEVGRIMGVDDKDNPITKIDTIKDTWTFEPVDLLGFHISDITTPYNDLQKAQWIAEEFLVPRNWIRIRTKRGWLCDKMDYETDTDNKPPDSQAHQFQIQRFQTSGFIYQEKKKEVRLYERWGLCPASWVMSPEEMASAKLEEEDLVESVIIVANRKAILKLEKNPWFHQQKPYVACPYIAKEAMLPGMGAAKVGRSLQEEINDTRNQTMDNKTLILSTMWLKSRGSGIKDKDLVIRPNGVITTNDMEGLMPLRPPVVTGIGTNMEGIAKDDLRESVGAASNLQGIAQAGVGTATEASTINRESIGRLLLVASMFSELVIKQAFIMAEYLNYQFYDHVKVIRVIGVTGAKYRQLDPKEISGGQKDVIIRISTDSTENPAVMRQQYMNFVTMILGMNPQLVPMYYKMLDRAYGMFFRGHKLSEIITNPVPVDPSELLSPEEERDAVLAEKAVVAQQGQDHKQYVEYLEKELKEMEPALNQMQNILFHKLIQSHVELFKQELQQAVVQHQQMMQQAAMQQNQGKQGNMIDKGRTQNSTPYNQTAAPTTGSLAQETGNNA